MNYSLKSVVVIGALLAVSACGSTTTSTFIDNTPTFSRDVLNFTDASDDLRSSPTSSASSVANATGVYTGQTFMRVLGGPNANFLGTANLTVDIGEGRVSGNLRGFRGGANETAPETFTGSLKVSGQSISNTGASFSSNVAGQLTSPTTNIVVNTGTLTGNFLNSPTDTLFASGTPSATVNGVPGRVALINVIADKQ